jgi:hypothetical protein
MPGTISVQNAQGAPTISPDADFGICLIGRCSSSPVSAGQVTPPYSNPAAAVTDLGLGDTVDAGCQAITVRPTNPAPRGVSFYVTPATTPGVRGTLTTSGVVGSSVVTATSSTHPTGTYQIVAVVVTGCTIGVTGGVVKFSLDGGRTYLPAVTLGTATTKKVQVSVNGVLTDTGVQYDFAAGTLIAGDTWSESKTTPPIWADADLYTAGPPAAGAFAAIAQSSNSYGLLAITEPVAVGDFSTLVAGLNYLATFNKRPTLIIRFRDPGLVAGATTVAAGSDAAVLPQATINVASTASFTTSGVITIGSDTITYTGKTSTTFTGCSGGSGTLATSEAVTQSVETDAQYVTAFQVFRDACQDARVACVAGNGWLTDAFRGFRYYRSGLPALLARLQWAAVNPGSYGERLAKSPAYGGDGPLPDFTLLDDNGNPISLAHDEFVRGGIDGPGAGGNGGGITFCYQRAVGVAGTYISEAPCLYPAGSTVLTLMDARVSSGIQRELYAVAWTMIQSTAVVNGGVLDPDLAVAMAARMREAILAKFSKEIANPNDPNLVVVNPSVTVSGPSVTISVSVNDRLFDYVNAINITLYNTRS